MIEVGTPFFMYIQDVERKKKIKKAVEKYIKSGNLTLGEALDQEGIDYRYLIGEEIQYLNKCIEELRWYS